MITFLFSHVFLLQIGGEETIRSGNEDAVTRAPLVVEKPPTQSSQAAQRVSAAGEMKGVLHVNEPRRLKTSTADNIIPGLSSPRTISATSHPETQGRNSNKVGISPENSSGIPEPRHAESSPDSARKDIIPGLSLSSTIGVKGRDSKATKEGRPQENFPVSGADTRITAKGRKKTSAQHKMKQIIAPTTSGKGEISPPIMQRAFSTKASCAQDQQKLPDPSDESFSCELSRKSFSSRQGLFIHFGKQKKHVSCKHKESSETCLRVFDTEVKLSQHKKSHK